MDSHWVHGRPGYRCRHGHTSTRTKASPRPKTLYIREDHLLDRIRHDRGLHRHHPRCAAPTRKRSLPTCAPEHDHRVRPPHQDHRSRDRDLHAPPSGELPHHHGKNPPPTGRGSRKTRKSITRRVEITCPRIRTRVPSSSAGKRCACVDRSHCGAHCNSPTEASVPGLFDAVAPGAKPV
ncbi:hypothetical protein [Micromonospora sicca]|uniref:hypothetical protein n=1 Tax=Micromonospora sicca TaxID=2202420 RepID=UPI001F19823E|nr:hypothetical protein [Micromonospora sp. 4G51]